MSPQQPSQGTTTNQAVKPVTLISQTSSAIPGLAIPGVYNNNQILPSINNPPRKSILALPQNYHSYKSQSESPFQARKKSNNNKSIVVNNNQVKLDKIDENTEGQGGDIQKARVQVVALTRQNRSISPRIKDKDQLKNTLNTSNKTNLTRPQKIQQPNEQQNLRNPPLLSQSQRLKNQNQEQKNPEKPLLLIQQQGISQSQQQQQQQLSNTQKLNMQMNSSQPLQTIPEQQKQSLGFANQRLQGAQVVLLPKNISAIPQQISSPQPVIQQNAAKKPAIATQVGNQIGSPVHNTNNENNMLKFYIGGGNNAERIRKLLSKRDGWVETKDPTSMFVHFKWQQSTRGYKYEKLVENNTYKQVVNHFEYHREISNKQYLIKNLMSFAESMKQNVFDITPLTYVIDFNDDNCDLILNNFLKFFDMNMPNHLKKKQTNSAAKANDIRKILRTFQSQYGQQGTEKLFNYFYTRWSLQDTFLDQEKSSYMWLLKPTFMNRGRGIHVFNSLQSLEKIISDYSEGIEEKSLKKPDDKPAEEVPLEPTTLNSQHSGQKQHPSSSTIIPSGINEDTKTLEEDQEEQLKETSDVNQQQSQKEKENQPQLSSQLLPPTSSPEVKRISQNGNNFQIKKLRPLQLGVRANSTAATNTVSTPSNASISNSNKPSKKEKEDPNKNIRAVPTGPFILKANQFVVQKYIEKPLLIHNRKFDIRVWALVTHNFDVYFFREGYIRLSSSEFTTDESQLDNLFIHLTNNAIQKYSDSYGQFENGNMWSFVDLWSFLEKHYENPDQVELQNQAAKFYKKKIVSKIKDVIWLTFCSVKKKLNQHDRKHCFEMFGFDFLVDANLNTWLIEVNTNPAIEECSKITQALVPRALDDAFKLTLDQIFPRKQNNSNTNANQTAPGNNETKTGKDKSPQQQNEPAIVNPEKNLPINENPDDEEDNQNSDQEQQPITAGTQQGQQEEQSNQFPSSIKGTVSPVKQTASQGNNSNNNSSEEPEYYPVPGYDDTFNMWELLGNLRDSSNVQVKKRFKQLK